MVKLVPASKSIMDSNTHQTQNPVKPSSARKLPIKRKTPTSTTNPNPHFPDTLSAAAKPHRIWTESDEIRFLQGLVDCYNDGLVFPRDLFVFYDRFSRSVSQHRYTNAQLGEKLGMLKMKFRSTSDRLGRGVELSGFSAHDQALFELSKRLWHSDYECTSPFGKSTDLFNGNVDDAKNLLIGNDNDDNASVSEIDLVGMIQDSFAPALPLDLCSLNDVRSSFDEMMMDSFDYDRNEDHVNETPVDEFACEFNRDDARMNEMKVEDDFGRVGEDISDDGNVIGKCASAKLIVDVFDDALKEVRATYFNEMCNGSSSKPPIGGGSDFEKRWREQRVAELDVLASRCRLIIEKSLQGQR